MDSNDIAVIIAFVFSWLTTISGVALGGWLVFRTKREPYESSLFGSQPKGDAFIISDGLEDTDRIQSGAHIPVKDNATKATIEAGERFLKQFEQKIMGVN